MEALANGARMDMSGKPHSDHFLAQIDRLIDLRPFALLIESIGSRMRAEAPPGMVKMLLLSRWYSMNQATLLEACQDRQSFRKFLGLPLEDGAEDARLAESYRSAAQFPMECQNLAHAIEAQLLAKGFSVRPGMCAEARVVPVAHEPVTGDEASNDLDFTETALFQPGELSSLLENSEKALVRGITKMAATGAPPPSGPVALLTPAVPAGANVVAVVEWPSGATTELSARLNIGRDPHFCPFATGMRSDLHVSRRHAVLEVCAEGIRVRDLDSRNGTFVDDELVPSGRAVLVDSNAQIRFGPHSVVRLTVKR